METLLHCNFGVFLRISSLAYFNLLTQISFACGHHLNYYIGTMHSNIIEVGGHFCITIGIYICSMSIKISQPPRQKGKKTRCLSIQYFWSIGYLILLQYLILLNTCWLYTVWKFQDFSVRQILREINFWESRSSKTAYFAILGVIIL